VIESGYRIHALWNSRRIKLRLPILVHNDVPTPNLRLEPLNLSPQTPIGLEKVALNDDA